MEDDWALAPLAFIVRVVGGFMLLVTLLLVPFVVFGSGSFLGIGEDTVCVETPLNGWSSEAQDGLDHLVQPQRDVTVTGSAIRLCDSSPSGQQRFLSSAGQGVSFLYAAGLMLALSWLIRSVRQQGFFVPRIALGVGRLGLYVLLGGLGAAFLHAWATARLADSMISSDIVRPGIVENVHGLTAPVLAGFGLLTLGRVLARAVPMQRELDTTV